MRLLAAIVILPYAAFAQASIQGLVLDPSGAAVPDAARRDDEGVRRDDELMEPREERLVRERFGDERVRLLLERQVHEDPVRTAAARSAWCANRLFAVAIAFCRQTRIPADSS